MALEIGPFRVSTDALQAINQFLDEFIVLLVGCSLSLDLSEIKSTVFNLLPSTLGKNAIVEAELEVKTFTETESIDYELYERMRKIEKDKFPVDEAIRLLREKCFEYCTLADKEDQLYVQKSIQKRSSQNTIVISPIVAIYVTTVMEHIAEYLLTAVAMSAEHEDTDYVRVKEVYLALVDDIQLGSVFNKMNLKDRMEKRAGLANKLRGVSYLPTPPLTENNNNNNSRKSFHSTTHENETGSVLDFDDDIDLDYFDDNLPKSNLNATTSSFSSMPRPHSVISHHSNTSRKSTFHVFKNNRNSFSSFDLPSRAESPVASIYDPDNIPNMNFDDLVKSGGTVKVSLTPNRLRSIEVKDQTKDEEPSLTWERRSISSPRLSTSSNLSQQTSKKSSNIVLDHKTIDVPRMIPKGPASPLGKKSFTVNDLNRFENPREAPKPPKSASTSSVPVSGATTTTTTTTTAAATTATATATATTSVPATIEVAPVTKKPLTPLPAMSANNTSSGKLTPLSKLPTPPSSQTKPVSTTTLASSSSSDSISSSNSSLPSLAPVPVVSSPHDDEHAKQSAVINIQDNTGMIPKSTRSNTINTSGIVMRRSSLSSRKSRESLRRKKSMETQEAKPADDAKPEETPETKQVQFLNSEEEKKKHMPERPSSIVAKRASMIGNIRRRSLHENYATEKYNHEVSQRGSVSVSIKQWDDILKSEEQPLIPPAAQRRSMLRQMRQQQLQEMQQEKEGVISNAVLDKVLKFERASSLDDGAHQRVSSLPRRERFLYLQQDPSAIERKSTSLRPGTRTKGIDVAVQTEPIKKESVEKKEEEQGLIDGDEEWFLQDDEWDEQEETAIVEWLLGEC
ncbi:unnamed protein product [Rhizopus microsporus]